MINLRLPENIEFNHEMASEAGRILSEIVEMDLWEGDHMLTDGLSAAGVPDGLVNGYATAIVTAVKETRDAFPEQSPFLTGYGVGLAVAGQATKDIARDIVNSDGYAIMDVDCETMISDANTEPVGIREYLGGMCVAAGVEYTPLTDEEIGRFNRELGLAWLDKRSKEDEGNVPNINRCDQMIRDNQAVADGRRARQ